jgi:DNA-binding GntR family transcriptional regulator
MNSTSTQDMPLAERAYRGLRTAIVRCEFEPGARLRVEDLTRRFEVSNSPVREALSRLSEQGFVRAIDNRGFRVAPLTVEGIADITRARLLIECEVLRDSVMHGTDAWEASIVAAGHSLALVEQRLSGKAVALDNAWSERHRAFHLAFYSSCSSPLLIDLATELFDRAERYRRYSASHRLAELSKHNEHQQLMQAVLSRNADKAVTCLRKHIGGTEQRVSAALKAMKVSAQD